METTPSTPTLNETDEKREQREFAERETERKRRYAAAEAFEPNVGVGEEWAL